MSLSSLFKAGNISTLFNIMGAVVLFFALLPPFFDTRKSKKTFPIGEKFFRYYMLGSLCMLTNAVFMVVKNAVNFKNENIALLVMFGVFVITNGTSVYLNTYMWKVKKSNLKKSSELGISEQEYWEQYLNVSKE